VRRGGPLRVRDERAEPRRGELAAGLLLIAPRIGTRLAQTLAA
jgi:hypothetical protein